MRALALLVTALLFPTGLAGQTIRGKVYEYGTRTPVQGATVEVVGSKGQKTVATTDTAGYFVLYPASGGRLSVHATHPSYVAAGVDTVSVRPKETVTLILRMTRQAIQIAPLVVTARSASALGGFHERQRRNVFGRFMDEQEIQRRRPMTFSQLLRGTHGLEVEESMGSSRLVLRGNGFGACSAAVYVDGIPLSDGSDLESVVPLSRVAAVEVYPDAAGVPAEFTSLGTGCGAVAFWTRPIRDGSPVTLKRIAIASVLIGAIILLQRAFASASESDISDRQMRDFSCAPEVSPPAPAAFPERGGSTG